MVDLIRTEIRRRHRQASYEESRQFEADANKRLDDCVSLGSMPELQTFQDVEAFCKLSRREVFKEFGSPDPNSKRNTWTRKELEGVVNSY